MLTCLLASTHQAPPSTTWLFAVSCLDFKSRSFAVIPEEGRTDSTLIASLGDPKHTVWLKGHDANTKRIDYEYREMLHRVQPGDVLLVYYTGHGYVRQQKLFFATWNADIGSQGWSMKRAFDQIRESFQGKNLVFFADCCKTGPLTDLAKGTRKPVAILGASEGESDAPMDWTFTNTVAKIIRGDSRADDDGDGHIDWNEAVKFFASETHRPASHWAPNEFNFRLDVAH